MLAARRLGWALAATAFGAGAVVLASALSARADPFAVVEGEALDVSADRLDVDVEHGTAELRGNVTARLGDLEVRCPAVEVRYDKSPRVSWLRGTGGVAARLKGIDATATTAEFDASARTIALHGSVRLSRGRGWLTAENATIDVASGKVSLQEVRGSIPVDPVRK
jgi:lipopolysaccharide export system protein LptA